MRFMERLRSLIRMMIRREEESKKLMVRLSRLRGMMKIRREEESKKLMVRLSRKRETTMASTILRKRTIMAEDFKIK